MKREVVCISVVMDQTNVQTDEGEVGKKLGFADHQFRVIASLPRLSVSIDNEAP